MRQHVAGLASTMVFGHGVYWAILHDRSRIFDKYGGHGVPVSYKYVVLTHLISILSIVRSRGAGRFRRIIIISSEKVQLTPSVGASPSAKSSLLHSSVLAEIRYSPDGSSVCDCMIRVPSCLGIRRMDDD